MMAIFMDRRGYITQLYTSRGVTFDQVKDWGLGTVIVSTNPFDVAVPLCVGYVVVNGKYTLTRLTDIQHDPMVGYRVAMEMEDDRRQINLIAPSSSYSMIKSSLMLKSWEHTHEDILGLFGASTAVADPWFDLGVNAGLRLFGERFENQIQIALKQDMSALVDETVIQTLMRLDQRPEFTDMRSIGLITGYYTGVRSLQTVGSGLKMSADTARLAMIKAMTNMSQCLAYHRSVPVLPAR